VLPNDLQGTGEMVNDSALPLDAVKLFQAGVAELDWHPRRRPSLFGQHRRQHR
jgi:hypothetical protein